jgi:hypothetical protein
MFIHIHYIGDKEGEHSNHAPSRMGAIPMAGYSFGLVTMVL